MDLIMTIRRSLNLNALALAGCLLASTSTIAGEAFMLQDVALQPLQAHTINTGAYTAVVYYTVNGENEYDVVTTIAPNVGVSAITTQHRARITQGQSYEVALDSGVYGVEARLFSFTAKTDALVVATR